MALLLFPLPLFADGAAEAAGQGSQVTQASDASFDKRLPPVLPGERMKNQGHDVRVWSTAGEVPVNPAPEPFKDQQMIDDFVRNKGIVVDARSTPFPPQPPQQGQPAQ